MNDPLVSVLMTAYNRDRFIGEAIESVLASSYTNFELIIVDDDSKDNTVEIARNYEAIDKRIRVYINEKNLGDYPNRNKAASYAKGKYLKYLDADDAIYKYTLSIMVHCMENYPEAALGISVYNVNPDKPFPQISAPADTYREEFLGKGFLAGGPSAAIIKKECFDKAGGFSGKKFIGDTELWHLLAWNYSIIKLQPHLIWWRQHAGQQIKQERKNVEIINTRYQFSIQQLSSVKSLFNKEQLNYAVKRIKRNHARGILKMMLRENTKTGYKIWKMSGLTLQELLAGFRPYIF